MPTGAANSGCDQLFRHARKRHRVSDAGRYAQQAFGDVEQSRQARAAAGQHAAGAQRLKHSTLAQIVAQQVEELTGARLENLAQ